MAITLRRNDVDLESWHLTGPTEMAAAADALKEHGYRAFMSANEDGSWKIELNSTDDYPPITAQVGDWLVWDMGLRLIKDTDAGAAAGYHLAGEA